MRKAWVVGGLLVAGAAVAMFGIARLPAVQDKVFLAVAERNLGRNYDDLFDGDALNVLVCGASSPLPDPGREQACVIVFAGDRFYVVDVGPGSEKNLGLWMLPRERIGSVFLTHLHSDHIGGLAELQLHTWVAGRPAPLDVYGPPGVERVVAGLSEAYGPDSDYRIRHHSDGFLTQEALGMNAHVIQLPEPAREAKDRSLVIHDDGKLKITAIEVDHKVVEPAYAYRFDYGDRAVVISGDTAYHPPLAVASEGADVLLHEANATHLEALIHEAVDNAGGNPRFGQLHRELDDYHTSPVDAARIANQAKVPQLVLYHLMPPVVTRAQIPMFMRGVDAVRQDGILLADDGLLIELPLGSDAIEIGSIE